MGTEISAANVEPKAEQRLVRNKPALWKKYELTVLALSAAAWKANCISKRLIRDFIIPEHFQ